MALDIEPIKARLATAMPGAWSTDTAALITEIERLTKAMRAERAMYEQAFRDLWEHPEFNRRLHSWVESFAEASDADTA